MCGRLQLLNEENGMTAADALGTIACLLTTCEILPQIFKMHVTKSAKDLSWASLMITFACFTSWVIYGVIQKDHWVSFTCSIALVEYVWLCLWKRHYDRGGL